MPGLKHFPDKPIERNPEVLSELDGQDYICQQKCDGWRLEVCKTIKGKLLLLSRHNNVMNEQVEPSILEELEKFLSLLPSRCQLDGEWLSRRNSTHGKATPHLVLFDVVRYDGRYLLDEPYENRLDLLYTLYADLLEEFGDDINHISLSETANAGEFVSFYEKQKTIARSEGVVIKHRLSTLIGDRKECKKNPRWFKIRYRAASDGAMTMKHLRAGQKIW